MVLSGRRFPGPGTAEAAHFEGVTPFRLYRGDPVEPVAPELHHSPARAEIVLQGVEHVGRPVLRMGSRHDHPVGAQQAEPFPVQVRVGDDVVIESLVGLDRLIGQGIYRA